VRPAVDDLRELLVEAADRAAEHARAPGPAAALRRVQLRRRRLAAATCLVLVVVATVGIAVGRLGSEVPSVQPATTELLPWRSLEASEWRAAVPDEKPVDPILVAAQGTQAGQPWRLTVYGSVYQPAGQSPTRDVCYILEWFAVDGHQRFWQANGTCAPQSQTATVLAVPAPGSVAVIGRAPAAASRVRLELPNRAPIVTRTVGTRPALFGRFYVAFVSETASLKQMVAIDDTGRQVGHAPGPGPLTTALGGGFPPTGPAKSIVQPTASHGRVKVVVWPTRYGFCLAVGSGAGGGSSVCDTASSDKSVLDPQTRCEGEQDRWQASVSGGMPRSARSVRVEVAGRRFEVRARDAGPAFDRSLFFGELPLSKKETTVRLTARDASGRTVRTWSGTYSCG
jgi:hypothetical protein